MARHRWGITTRIPAWSLRGRTLIGAGLLGASLLSSPVVANDLNAAQRAVRLQDFNQAYQHYRRAAETGNHEAQYQLGNLYSQGRGTRKNEQQARHWFEQAAAGGHAAAQFALAQILATESPERAQSLLQAAADQGLRSAQVQLQRQPSGARINEQASLEAQWFGAARSGQIALLQTLSEQQALIGKTDDAGRTALFYAVTSGQDSAVDWLLAQGADVNHRDNFNLTVVQTAIERRKPKLVQKLLAAGGDKHQTYNNGDNLLHYAIRLQLYDQVPSLLQLGVPVNQQNQRGWTPLDLAEYQGAARTIEQLRQNGGRHGDSWRQARAPQDLAAVSELLAEERLPAVAKAIVNSNTRLLDKLLREDPRAVQLRLEDDSTLLILAVKHRNTDAIQTLLRHGANVNQPAYRGTTALQVAVQTGQEALVDTLLKAGADPILADDSGRDAVIYAIQEQQPTIALNLLHDLIGGERRADAARNHLRTLGVPVDRYLLLATQYRSRPVFNTLLPYAGAFASDEQGRTALWFAAADGDAETLTKLLNAQIDARQADAMGRTPFFMAVDKGCQACAEILLSHSDINQPSSNDNTALINAAAKGDAAMTRWLIQNRANVEARNQRGETAVMLAVKGNHVATVQHLLDANANVTRKNRLGRSALDLSREVSPQMHELVRNKTVLGIF